MNTTFLCAYIQSANQCVHLSDNSTGRYIENRHPSSPTTVRYLTRTRTTGQSFALFCIRKTDVARKIKRRGAAPGGGGEIQFLCPIVKQVKTINFVDPGKIKRIRGVA